MINTIVWGFNSRGASHAIEILKQKQIIDVKTWFGTSPYSTHYIIDIFEGNFTKSEHFGVNQEIYQEMFSNSIYPFMDMMSRHTFYKSKSFHDQLNIYNLLLDYFNRMLEECGVELILFSNLPHEGPDLVLYNLAREKNVKTLLFYQSIFPDKFFYIYNLDDFGKFLEIPEINIKGRTSIPKKHDKGLVYMQQKFVKNIPFSLESSSFISLVRSIFDPNHFTRVRSYMKVKRAESVSADSDQDTILKKYLNFLSGQIQRYKNHKIAKKFYSSIISKKIEFDQKFIYFPLHLQPELTTSMLGGIYVDQLLAVERLSKIIPSDWYIYLKENPKQTEKMRGKWFFKRLKKLKNVKLIPPDFNTYQLMDACLFVVTITGTAGWEAITGGKNVLIFGNPWYKTLPGVFSFDEEFSLEKIMHYTINHEELEEEFNALLGKMGNGVIDESYASLVKNYDLKINSEKIASFIENQIT